jgi:hypothetical protein
MYVSMRSKFVKCSFETSLITLQQEAEHVEQEEDARTIQVGEKSFIIHDRELMSGDIADDIRYANHNQ